MSPAELKPILTALVLPPALPLLCVLLGGLLAWRRRVRTGVALVVASALAFWLVCCQAVAMCLAAHLLPQVEPIPRERLAGVGAIVVLGGGVLPNAPEYGAPQPNASTLGRLRYAALLARTSGKPVAFAGGVGWASAHSSMAPEAEVARAAIVQFGVPLRWADASSRDTGENAREVARLLQPAGIGRIALVTDSWHMPRSVLAFRRAGFDVVPAPTGFPAGQTRALLSWLPSAEGLTLSRQVLREALGLALARVTG